MRAAPRAASVSPSEACTAGCRCCPGRAEAMTGRLVRSADFERVLGAATKARSAHFAVHHLPGRPSLPEKPVRHRSKMELSTDDAPVKINAVDESLERDPSTSRSGPCFWLGLVVPKRHARRSVTRSLFKRQIRAAAAAHAHGLPTGLWVVRLRAPFDMAMFPSAASLALQRAAREELDGLLAGLVPSASLD